MYYNNSTYVIDEHRYFVSCLGYEVIPAVQVPEVKKVIATTHKTM
jgi:hypothetical protein